MSGSIKNESPKTLLVLDGVCKNFGGVIANDHVSFKLHSGEVLGLIGPNGAGKTTLINLITGIYQPTQGTITFLGQPMNGLPTHKRAMLGMGRTFQHPHLLGRCDISTNIIMGADMYNRRHGAAKEDIDGELSELLECAGLENIKMDDPIDKLSYGQQKLLEVVRVLLSQPRIMLLDEPAAGLNNREGQYVAALIKYAVSKGIGVLLIEHSMELVMSICDDITVLNFGQQIAFGTPAEIQNDEEVIHAYLGGAKNA